MNHFIQNVVAEAIRDQPWYKRNANTVTAGIGAVAAALGFLVTLELPVPEAVTGAVPAVIAFLTALAVRLTKNGVVPSTAGKLEATATARATVPDASTSAYSGPSSVPTVSPSESGLPVWDQPSSRPEAGYVGQHRLDG